MLLGGGDLAKVFIDKGYNVKCSDIVNRGFDNTEVIDFLEYNQKVDYDIITNPPYSKALEFVEHGLELLKPNHKMAMFLKVQFLEGKKRRLLFDKHPPTIIYISSSRILCAKNGDFEGMRKGGGSAVAYAWYIWTYKKPEQTVVKWIN